MKYFTLLVAIFFNLKVFSQNFLNINYISEYVVVYDSAETENLPLINLSVMSFMHGADTNFVGIVDPAKKFKKVLDYPYPYVGDTPENLEFLSAVTNSNKWFKMNAEIVQGSLDFNWVESVNIFDNLLHYIDTVTMHIPYQYDYHGQQYSVNIELDIHDLEIFELDNKLYSLTIGTHLEWYDAGSSWLNDDSVLVRFTTLHVIDVATNTEKARWFPQHEGFALEDFANPAHVDVINNGLKFYSHPHLNVIQSAVRNNELDVFASFRQPGHIGKLHWDTTSNSITLNWLFGNPPDNTLPAYIETITTNQLNACHGAAPYISGDTVYIATYNNQSDVPDGGQHQVWRVLNDTASLVWQTPDIGVQTYCRGDAHWSEDGKYLMALHGMCSGVSLVDDGNGGFIPEFNYEKFQIWNPWTNSKIAAIQLPGSVNVFFSEFISDDKIPDLNLIDITYSDSILFTSNNPGIQYWTVGFEKHFTNELKLPLSYSDSLDKIAVWVQTGDYGVWCVDAINLVTNNLQNTSPDIFIPTLLKLGNVKLPSSYNWTIYDLSGRMLSLQQIYTAGFYILEGTERNGNVAYRKKHFFSN